MREKKKPKTKQVFSLTLHLRVFFYQLCFLIQLQIIDRRKCIIVRDINFILHVLLLLDHSSRKGPDPGYTSPRGCEALKRVRVGLVEGAMVITQYCCNARWIFRKHVVTHPFIFRLD